MFWELICLMCRPLCRGGAVGGRPVTWGGGRCRCAAAAAWARLKEKGHGRALTGGAVTGAGLWGERRVRVPGDAARLGGVAIKRPTWLQGC